MIFSSSYTMKLARKLLGVAAALAFLIILTGPIFLGVLEYSSIQVVKTRNDIDKVNVIVLFPHGRGPLAHYAEHLAWLPNIGKNSRPEDRDSNAWTNDYAVGYWLSGPPEDLPDMLRRLKVVFDPINLPQEFAETERDIADIAGYPVLRAGFTLINELRQQQRWQHERQMARSAERVAQSARQHAAIIAAIQARDAVAARVALQAHLA